MRIVGCLSAVPMMGRFVIIPSFVMRRLLPLVLLLACEAEGYEEQVAAPRAQPWFSPCEILCANLKKSIEERPDMLVMRLEDALVINETCAGEIVTAAIDAVRAKPQLVRVILETAMKVVPARSETVMAAARSYEPGKVKELVYEEVRRAEMPPGAPLMEIRRAEPAHVIGPEPVEEIRRAEVSVRKASPMYEGKRAVMADRLPQEEIRPAEMVRGALPATDG